MKNNQKLAIIGANDFQDQLICRANELGFETHVFAWEQDAVGKAHADYFYPISITKKDLILEECRNIQPDGVCTIASDLAANTVTYVSQKLGLNSNSLDSISKCSDKNVMRKALSNNNVACPQFVEVVADYFHDELSKSKVRVILDKLLLPVIVKPSDRSGSRAITKLTKLDSIDTALREAIDASFNNSAIVEEYIEGKEFSCECISYHGKHHFLAFTEKFTTGSPHFIETGHRDPVIFDEPKQQVYISQIFVALDALGITDSASHAEFKIDKDENLRIIEIGARMGGDCIGSDLVPMSTGYDFIKMVIDVACNHEPDLTQHEHYSSATIKFVFTDHDFDKMNKLIDKKNKNIIRVSDMNTDNFGKITDSSTRVGYYIYTD